MRSRLPYLLPFLIILFLFAGCGKKVSGLLTLKELSNQQEQMARDISASDARFEKLVLAIYEGRLSEDYSRRSILRQYGEPILREEQTIDGDEFEVWLYRYAKEFFGSNKAYLYFDKSGKLKRWQYVEAKEVDDVQVRKETPSEAPSP